MFTRGDVVKLAVDLSGHYPSLGVGAIGKVVGPSKRGYHPLVRVHFAEAGTRDIRSSYLRPAGEDQTPTAGREITAEPRAPLAETAYQNASLILGPRGGFKSLSYQVISGGRSEDISLSSKLAIEKALAELEAKGVPVERREG